MDKDSNIGRSIPFMALSIYFSTANRVERGSFWTTARSNISSGSNGRAELLLRQSCFAVVPKELRLLHFSCHCCYVVSSSDFEGRRDKLLQFFF